MTNSKVLYVFKSLNV